MKKVFSVFLVLLLFVSLSLPAFGMEDLKSYVVDNADLLTDSEEESLQQQIQSQRELLSLDIVIVTTYGTQGKGVQAYADDFYDQNGYGFGENETGILLLIDMESREWYMSTCGDANYIFTDYGLDQLGQTILPWLSSGKYYEAFDAWVNGLEHYVDAFRDQSPIDGYVQPDDYDSLYGDETVYYETEYIENPFLIALIVGLIAAAVTVLVMRSRMNTAKLQSGASDYMVNGSFVLRQRSDIFLYSRVTRSAKPKESSGGGSSVHRSSGGSSHGGRGGRF